MSSTVLVMNNNYLDSSSYAGFTYSSQLAAAPASNVLLGKRRSTPWRTAGYWKITSTNKTIVFQEVASVNIVATIVEGEYVTDALFLAAVKAALDLAGGTPVYTVARDPISNKIKITQTGGSLFRLMCSNLSFTAATPMGFSTNADLTGSLNYTADFIALHTAEWFRVDLGAAYLPTVAALLGTRGEAFKLTDSALVRVMGSTTDLWTSPAFSVTLTRTDDGVFSASLGASAYRYWRIEIIDPTNPLGYIEISKAYLGEYVAPTRGAAQFPLAINKSDNSVVSYADAGGGFADRRRQYDVLNFSWKALTNVEYELLDRFVEEVGTHTPFFIVTDRNKAYSTTVERSVRYVRFGNTPDFSLVSPNFWISSWNLREEI